MMRPTLCVLAVLALGCDGHHDAHDHASEHPAGHNHHEEGHGHGGADVHRVTRWSDTLEAFIEHGAIQPGKPASLLVHVTNLADFSPAQADLTLTLRGPAEVRAESKVSKHEGVYEVPFTVPIAGKYAGEIELAAGAGRVGGIVIEAHGPEEHHVHEHEIDAHGEATVEFLKEQQWGVPFATEQVTLGTLVAAIEVSGTIDTPPSGSAEIGAPISGRVVVPSAGLPAPGDAVRKGQLLVTLSPIPSSPEDAARAGLAIAETEARVATARAELERARRLLADRAIAAREVENAERELTVAEQAQQAAQTAAALFSNATSGRGGGSWRVTSPIEGTLVSVDVTPGAAVSAGQPLFHVVDTRELWIRARVPEQDAARLRTDRGARFRIAGLDSWHEIRLVGDGSNARIVTVSRTVDPTSRTVELIYALAEPEPEMRVGGMVEVSVPAGEELIGVVIARSALLDHQGRDVVYVQIDGEHFEQRSVRVGPAAADRVGITHGLSAGERIVTRGAHLVRLADRPKHTEAHGHIH